MQCPNDNFASTSDWRKLFSNLVQTTMKYSFRKIEMTNSKILNLVFERNPGAQKVVGQYKMMSIIAYFAIKK